MIYAIIQARMNSTRFPGKVLATLDCDTVLGQVVQKIKRVLSVDHITVATHRNGCHSIVVACRGLDVKWYIHDGNEIDVLGRFVACLDKCHALDTDLVVRVCADSPLLDPIMADNLISAAVKSGADYTGYQIDGQPAVLQPTGLVCEVVKVGALRHANDSLTDDEPMREHVTQIMYRKPVHFRCHWLPMPEWYTGERWALDTPADLVRIEEEMVHGY